MAPKKPAAEQESETTSNGLRDATGELDLSRVTGEGWRPKEGDEIRGQLRTITRGWSDWQNAFYPILTIAKDGTGELVSLHCFHDVLLKQVLSLKPKIGEYVGCRFHGEEQTKDGKRTVKLYTFAVQRDSEESDPYEGLTVPEPVTGTSAAVAS